MRLSALLVAHLDSLNYVPRALTGVFLTSNRGGDEASTGPFIFVSSLFALHDPVSWLAQIDTQLVGGDGIFEMRAIYGGVGIGAGILLLIAVFKPELYRAALIFTVAYCGGHMVGRVAGFIYDGAPQSDYTGFILYELVLAIIAAWFLFALRNKTLGRRVAGES